MFDSSSIYFGKNVKQLKATVPMKIKKKKKNCDLIMVLQKQNKRLWN